MHRVIMGMFLFLLGLLTANPLHAGSNCSLYLADVPLSIEAVRALHEAEPYFKVTPMSATIDGRPRVVFVVGETNSPTLAAQERGLALLRQFKTRGLESAGPADKSLVGRYLRTALNLAKGAVGANPGLGDTIRAAESVVASDDPEVVNISLDQDRRFYIRKGNGPEMGLITSPPEVLAASVFDTFKTRTETQALLAVVSKHRRQNVVQTLADRYGFSQIDLPRPVDYLGLDNYSGWEAHLKVLEIAERRKKAAVYTTEINGVKREVVLLASPQGKEVDPIERAVIPFFDSHAAANFDGRGLSAIKAAHGLRKVLRFFGIGRNPGNPVWSVEDEFVRTQINPANYSLAPNRTYSFNLGAGYRRTFADQAPLLVMAAAQVLTVVQYGILAYHGGIPDAPTTKALLVFLFIAPELMSDYASAEVLLSIQYRDTRWYQKLFPAMTTSLIRRDQTIRKNFSGRFEQDPSLRRMLIAVDEVYFQNVTQTLEREGFKRESFAGLYGER